MLVFLVIIHTFVANFNYMNTNYEHTWVFLSHSNKDFDKLRKVRDRLEELNFRPLLFFMKCLEDDKEIFDLIKREIEARERFIYCKSKFAEDSDWVRKEVAYIKFLNRPYEIIDLDVSEQAIEDDIMRFNQRSTLYLWSKENRVVKEIKSYSERKAFKVILLNNVCRWDSKEFLLGQSDCLNGIVEGAYFIVLSSPDMTSQEWSNLEAFAKKHELKKNCFALPESLVKAKNFAKQVVDKLIGDDCREFNRAVGGITVAQDQKGSPIGNERIREGEVVMPIGKYARRVLTNLLERGILTASQIKDLKDAVFCKVHLNMNYPVLVNTTENSYDKRRYYQATESIAPYVICNDWRENKDHRAKLNQWLIKSLLLENEIVV